MPDRKIACPRCKSTEKTRLHREGWMRLFPWSRHYGCRECAARYLVIFGRFALKVG